MKKLLLLGLICVMIFTMVAMVSPASAGNGGSSDNSPIEGPPGWSHVNPGQGGSANPGGGPGGP
jgi:hypothetical protein